MKKRFRLILTLLAALYCMCAYADFKKGFVEGFYHKKGKPVQTSGSNTGADDYFFN